MVLYCPDYFTEEHETWYQMINESVNWQKFAVKVCGKIYNQPRDSFYMADNNYIYKYVGFDRRPDNWVVAVTQMKKVLNTLVQKIKHGHPKLKAVLGNRYSLGKQIQKW